MMDTGNTGGTASAASRQDSVPVSSLVGLPSLVSHQTTTAQFNSFIKYPEVKLDRVLGLTVQNNSSIDCDLNTGTVVYVSGCVLVLYNQRRNKQQHIINSSKKPLTACKFSKDGKYIVTGECGHQPQVRVWDVATGEQVSSLSGHKYGINCVGFSPDGKYVVSVGSQHDMMVNLWDWRSNHIAASNKVSAKVKSISFSETGEYIVTVGLRHVKFWYLDYNKASNNRSKFESAPLVGRNAILGDQRDNYFCDVACGRGDSKEFTYAITKSGLLCEFNNRRLLNKWVELKTEHANCITISKHHIIVGCDQGVIRCFRPETLEFICTLPRPHFLGIDIAKGLNSRSHSKPKYADTIAAVYDEYNRIVTAVYSDRSIYFWSINDVKKIGKLNSFLYHSSCIWDLDVYPSGKTPSRQLLPPGTFLTCSSDDTIRIWNTELEMNSSKMSYIYKKNCLSPELMKILYMDLELVHLCDPDLTSTKGSANGNGLPPNAADEGDKNGIRSIKFSPDGKHLASGDRYGNIRIFDFEKQRELFKLEAHDAEVLCLEYSDEEISGRALLVSASRDRFIHIYDVHRQYCCIQNIDDHSAAITSVKFVAQKHFPSDLLLISCSTDKSLIFRKQQNPDSDFRLEHHVAGKSTYYDMAVDQKKNHIITSSQDRIIRTYDAKTGKSIGSFKGSLGEEGALIKISFDPSATFVATSCTDKSIYIFDYQTGECLAATSGHSEIITGLKFSLDGRHLISISGDGCLFVWRLPVEMTNAIASKLGMPLISDSCHTTTITNRSLNLPLQTEFRNNTTENYRLNDDQLPTWVKRKMYDTNDFEKPAEREFSKTLPRGIWGQRIREEGGDLLLGSGLVKAYANTFESMASRSTPTTPSGINSPSMKDAIRNQRSSLILPRESPRTKSSMSSGVEDDDDDRNTTDSDNTCTEASYKVNKASDRSGSRGSKHLDSYSMVSSISMANINDLPYDDEDGSASEDKSTDDSKHRFSSLYMSTENLERIEQKHRYLKNAFENIDKCNIENNNSASDDSGINQIDHSIGSNTTSSSTLVNNSPPQPHTRQSLSSKFKKSPPKDSYATERTSDDADATDSNPDQPESITATTPSESAKTFSVLDTIRETSTTPTVDIDNDSSEVAKTNRGNSSSTPETDSSTSSGTNGNTMPSSSMNGQVDNTSSTTVTKTPMPTPKRKALDKQLSEVKKTLESIGSYKGGSLLTNSKSVVNLRSITSPTDTTNEKELNDNHSYHSLSFDSAAFRKSISCSDLSATLPRNRLSVHRNNAGGTLASPGAMNNYQFAPLWDQRRGPASAGGNPGGPLSRTPSNSALNKVDMMRSQSTLCRQGLWSTANSQNNSPQSSLSVAPQQPSMVHMKPPVPTPMNGNGSPGMMINPRSGRLSAPPSQLRKTAATLSCASSSRRGDSTEDDEELDGSAINSDDDNSDEHRTVRPRPVTPPKPNIMKQIRRTSNPNGNPLNAAPVPPGGYPGTPTQPHLYVQNHQPMAPTRPGRRLWSTDTMRSSKSEFNLASIGRDTPMRRRTNSGATMIGPQAPPMAPMWPPNPTTMINDRLDLRLTNPSSIPLSLDLCQHLVDNMNFLTNYASRIHERASYSDKNIVDYLNETLGQVSRDLQAIVARSSGTNSNTAGHSSGMTNGNTNGQQQQPSLPAMDGERLFMFQKFMEFIESEKLAKANPTASTNGTTDTTATSSNSNSNSKNSQQ